MKKEQRDSNEKYGRYEEHAKRSPDLLPTGF